METQKTSPRIHTLNHYAIQLCIIIYLYMSLYLCVCVSLCLYMNYKVLYIVLATKKYLIYTSKNNSKGSKNK